uniref:Uncharacterized protein n=1 Tax=Glossina palpalis gambiensis TaxID=67801 RepID=A0A1B0BQP8_9MUSC
EGGGLTDPTVDIRELEFEDIIATAAALGLFSCWELGLPKGDGPPPIRNCEVKLEYISGVGAVAILGAATLAGELISAGLPLQKDICEKAVLIVSALETETLTPETTDELTNDSEERFI